MAKCPRQQKSFPQVYFSIDNVGFRGHQERFKKRFIKIRLRGRHSNDLHLPNKENRYENIQKASGVFTIYLPTIQLGNFKSRLKNSWREGTGPLCLIRGIGGRDGGGGRGHKESLGSGVPQRPWPCFRQKLFICLPWRLFLFFRNETFGLSLPSLKKGFQSKEKH